jgi:hypothetical protein
MPRWIPVTEMHIFRLRPEGYPVFLHGKGGAPALTGFRGAPLDRLMTWAGRRSS